MTPLAGHTGSYYSYSFEQACAGLAEAGYCAVELSAVPGATEHVDVHGDPGEVRTRLDHSDLTTREGLEHGLAVVSWAERFGLAVVNTAIGGHAHVEESEDAFLRNIGPLADAAQAAGIVIALEIHGDLMASGERSRPLLDRIGHPAVDVEFTGGVPWPPLDEVDAAMRGLARGAVRPRAVVIGVALLGAGFMGAT